MYKVEELRNKSRDELLKLISELKGKSMALRFENATGQLNETHLLNVTKKDVAKVFTVLKEMEFNEQQKVVKNKKVNKKGESK